MDTTRYDVVIVGGGAAGLSAATTLGRALRSVLVIDSGTPRNAPAAGVHGYLSRDGMNPGELLSIGRSEVLSYGGTVIDGDAVSARRTPEGFEVILGDARRFTGRRLLVTTGLTDELPPIDGLREQWGKGVVHCPYCHGWEIRGQRIGVLGTGPLSVHQALLFRQWSPDITLFLNDTVEPTDEEWEKLAARSITVVDGAVAPLTLSTASSRGSRSARAPRSTCRPWLSEHGWRPDPRFWNHSGYVPRCTRPGPDGLSRPTPWVRRPSAECMPGAMSPT